MTLRWAYSPDKCEGYEFCGDCDTCPIRDEAKPTVFNYGDYIKLKSKMAHQADEIMKIKAENTDLKCKLYSAESKYDTATNIINIQQDIISNYGDVFKLLEAELKKLRNEVMNNESSTHDNKQTV